MYRFPQDDKDGNSLPVDFPAVADGVHAHLARMVIDLVENPVVTDADTPLVAAAGKFLGVVRTGL